MEREADRIEAEVTRHRQQVQCLAAGGPELARERPIRARGFHDQADVDLRAGGVFRNLLKLFFCVGGEEGQSGMMRESDVRGAFDGVAEGDMLGMRAKRQAQLDLAARCGVEMEARLNTPPSTSSYSVRWNKAPRYGSPC